MSKRLFGAGKLELRWRTEKDSADFIEQVAEIDGTVFYAFREIDYTITERYRQYEVLCRELSQNVPQIVLDEAIEFMLERIEKEHNIGRLKTDLIQLLTYTQQFSKMEVYEHQLFNAANILLLLEDEPLENTTNRHTAIKKDLYDNNPRVKAFFLSSILPMFTPYVPSLKDLNLAEYLNNPRNKTTYHTFLRMMDLEESSLFFGMGKIGQKTLSKST